MAQKKTRSPGPQMNNNGELTELSENKWAENIKGVNRQRGYYWVQSSEGGAKCPHNNEMRKYVLNKMGVNDLLNGAETDPFFLIFNVSSKACSGNEQLC